MAESVLLINGGRGGERENGFHPTVLAGLAPNATNEFFILMVYFIFNNAGREMFIDGLDVDQGTLPHIGYRGTSTVFLHGIISALNLT